MAADQDRMLPLHWAAWVMDDPAIIELLLVAAPESERARTHGSNSALQLTAFQAHLSSSRLLLERSTAPPTDLITDLLAAAEYPNATPACRDVVHALLADLAGSCTLSPANWEALPSPCPGLARALPAVLARSPAEAAQLVAHLPAAACGRLRTLALSLARLQQRLRLELPEGIVRRILLAAPVEAEGVRQHESSG
eukprot:scaffold5.g648.t1